MKKFRCICFVICSLIILSSISHGVESVPKPIALEVTKLTELPQWYQEKQNNITQDIAKRYNRINKDNIRYLIVDSFDKTYNVTVESTKNSIKLFLKRGKNFNLISSNPQGIMSVHWSHNNRYFSYINVTNAINETQIQGTLYLIKINTNINDIQKAELLKNISIGDIAWDNQNQEFVFTDYEKIYIYSPNSGIIHQIKDLWSKRPNGYPQRVDNIFFSEDGKNIIFRYCGNYAGDKDEYYQIDCRDLK